MLTRVATPRNPLLFIGELSARLSASASQALTISNSRQLSPTPSPGRSLPNRSIAGSHPSPLVFNLTPDSLVTRAAPCAGASLATPPCFQCFGSSLTRAVALDCCPLRPSSPCFQCCGSWTLAPAQGRSPVALHIGKSSRQRVFYGLRLAGLQCEVRSGGQHYWRMRWSTSSP